MCIFNTLLFVIKSDTYKSCKLLKLKAMMLKQENYNNEFSDAAS